MRVTGFMCGPRVYEYKGWTFEMGPMSCWPLTKNGDPRKKAGRKFYNMIGDFEKLGEKEQEGCRIGGGCQPIGY